MMYKLLNSYKMEAVDPKNRNFFWNFFQNIDDFHMDSPWTERLWLKKKIFFFLNFSKTMMIHVWNADKMTIPDRKEKIFFSKFF